MNPEPPIINSASCLDLLKWLCKYRRGVVMKHLLTSEEVTLLKENDACPACSAYTFAVIVRDMLMERNLLTTDALTIIQHIQNLVQLPE
jgi:hypothetical protein